MTHTPHGDEVWRYDRPKSSPAVDAHPVRQVVTQACAHGLTPYQRTIQVRPVTFTCAWCKQEVTQQRYPGKPHYCSESCERAATREKTLERVHRLRERQRKS